MLTSLFKKKEKNEREDLKAIVQEFEKAKEQLRVAELQYNVCDKNYIDIASENLMIAQKRVDLVVKKYKVFVQEEKPLI